VHFDCIIYNIYILPSDLCGCVFFAHNNSTVRCGRFDAVFTESPLMVLSRVSLKIEIRIVLKDLKSFSVFPPLRSAPPSIVMHCFLGNPHFRFRIVLPLPVFICISFLTFKSAEGGDQINSLVSDRRLRSGVRRR